MTQAKPDDGILDASELRHRLYDIAMQAELARLALDGMSERDTVPGLLAVRTVLKSIDDELSRICGGATFDRLEDKTAKVAS